MNSPRFDLGPREPAFNRWSIRDEKEEKEGKKEEDGKSELKPKERRDKEKDPKPSFKTTKDEKAPPKKEESSEKKTLSTEEKQEKRTEIIERSLEYKKRFEDIPVPKDPSTVARLIVAEHILDLDERIRKPKLESEANTKESLEETLDYMCLLAEKFEDPSIESPPQIQESYEALIELTQEMLNESAHPNELISEIVQTLETEKETAPDQQPAIPAVSLATPPAPSLNDSSPQSTLPPPQATPAPSTSAAITLITFLKYASRKKGSTSLYPTASSTHHWPSHSSMPLAHSNIEASPKSQLQHAEKFHTLQQPNIARPLAAIALTSVVAATIHKSPEISHRHEPDADATVAPVTFDSVPSTFPSRVEKPQTQSSAHAFERQNHTMHPTPLEHMAAPPHHEIIAAHNNRKLEHIPLLSLLTLAKDVHLGYGRYLKDEFEKGHIDKAGLIKVLKAKKKGLDISREYITQASDYRKRQGSIEFLSKSTDRNATANNTLEPPVVAQADNHKTDEAAKVTKEAFAHPVFERYAHPERSVFQTSPKSPIPVNLIVAIAAIVILGITIILLLLPVFA